MCHSIYIEHLLKEQSESGDYFKQSFIYLFEHDFGNTGFVDSSILRQVQKF